MDWRDSYHVTCFQCGLRHATIEDCVFCAWSVPRGYEEIQEWELTSLKFRSPKGTTVWPEEELENVVCDVTCAIFNNNLESVTTNCSYE
jgi:hypothetical protein